MSDPDDHLNDPDYFDEHCRREEELPWRDVRLAELRSRFEEDDDPNPLFVWEAIAICLGSFHGYPIEGRPLPDWTQKYLLRVAEGLSDLGGLKNPFLRPPFPAKGGEEEYKEALRAWASNGKVDASDAPKLALKVLGFDGTNWFKKLYTEKRSFGLAIAVALWGEKRALEDGKKKLHNDERRLNQRILEAKRGFRKPIGKSAVKEKK